MNSSVVISGLGASLPPRAVSNADLARSLDTSDEWIVRRTGISSRRWVDGTTSTSDLAVAAGRAALESSGSDRVDLLLLATTTPDLRCPATAPDVAWRMGQGAIPALDLAAVCSGFLYGLSVASAFIIAGHYRQVLLIGAETYSRIIDRSDRNTAVIFGDGAGAVVLRKGAVEEPGALLTVELGSDGAGRDLINLASCGGSVPQKNGLADEPSTSYLQMQGRRVFSAAVEKMADCSARVLQQSRWPVESIEAFVGHQANQRILDAVATRIGIPIDRCFGNISSVGNTAAASIPLAMAHAAAAGEVRPGARTLLSAFGGGLTWGSATLTWPNTRAIHHSPQPADDRPLHVTRTSPHATRETS